MDAMVKQTTLTARVDGEVEGKEPPPLSTIVWMLFANYLAFAPMLLTVRAANHLAVPSLRTGETPTTARLWLS